MNSTHFRRILSLKQLVFGREVLESKKQSITTIMSSQNNPLDIETCKANAARKAVEDNIKADAVIGIGSGSTMCYVLESLAKRCKEHNLSVSCVPTSYQSKQLIYDYKLPLSELERVHEVDIAIDGADEVDDNLVAIKGGGACLAQEKVVAFSAKKFVVVADYRKNSNHLGQTWKKGIPIEVLPMACETVRRHMAACYKVELKDLMIRNGKEKVGPVITDNGNMIIDWLFRMDSLDCSSSDQWKAMADKIKVIPGIVETGIFANMVDVAYFGLSDGTVIRKAK